MNMERYNEAIAEVHNGESYPGDLKNWNRDYRLRLRCYDLTLTNERPVLPYIEAPIPTPAPDGVTHTPSTDPHAWLVPAWIVPLDAPLTFEEKTAAVAELYWLDTRGEGTNILWEELSEEEQSAQIEAMQVSLAVLRMIGGPNGTA